ncbi:hypothetical protein E2C01_094833 [Portunus trituberculatus]|uniref:Uncharacterized protein n=1 Tax=Portunus trituberculatus TaxID=210409 RepID=A0A5B7JRI2_PORTR|nr:hypothetical protein [Portunus trituberculatus]
MSPLRVLALLMVLMVVMVMMTEEVEGVRRRRRRRRPRGKRVRVEGGNGTRRIRHAAGRRAEFVRRRLRKARRRNDEGTLRLIDGRAEWEGECPLCCDSHTMQAVCTI